MKKTITHIYWKLRKNLTRMGLEEFFQENLGEIDGEVLEIGAGRQQLKYNDVSKVVRLDIEEGDSIDVVADAHELPFGDNSYDAVFAKEVMEHLYNPHVAVDEIFRVLKPGGRFVASTCFYWPIHGQPIDYFRFTQFGLEKIFEKWSEVKIVPRTGVMGVLAVHLLCDPVDKRHFIRWLLYPILLSTAFCLTQIDKIFKSSPVLKRITSGYFVTAIKPDKTE